ncbi:hypothetical protein E2C01_066067 [Portunus trituberculatus]|uniref:Uncharacterized protein n=1 Tax=Portunus trituberculatus TaxID=210409 RepID=A0A5B7HSW1_PORTR|nr:hypothetical protein [Portunus trituberculatus]
MLETEAGSQPITAKLPRSVPHPANSNPENSLKRMWLLNALKLQLLPYH